MSEEAFDYLGSGDPDAEVLAIPINIRVRGLHARVTLRGPRAAATLCRLVDSGVLREVERLLAVAAVVIEAEVPDVPAETGEPEQEEPPAELDPAVALRLSRPLLSDGPGRIQRAFEVGVSARQAHLAGVPAEFPRPAYQWRKPVHIVLWTGTADASFWTYNGDLSAPFVRRGIVGSAGTQAEAEAIWTGAGFASLPQRR